MNINPKPPQTYYELIIEKRQTLLITSKIYGVNFFNYSTIFTIRQRLRIHSPPTAFYCTLHKVSSYKKSKYALYSNAAAEAHLHPVKKNQKIFERRQNLGAMGLKNSNKRKIFEHVNRFQAIITVFCKSRSSFKFARGLTQRICLKLWFYSIKLEQSEK